MVPDLWQQEAAQHLSQGRDVVLHAPTGAGKTFVFELFVEQGLKRQAIYTVPTRALANDKFYEWKAKGWNVGIATGDIALNLNAPLLVATLETQKGRFLRGDGPGILVVDEYQMLRDPVRGGNYELSIATAPPGTQLLLLSGSVGNPGKLVQWLQRIGREACLVQHNERPVPQEQIHFEALPDHYAGDARGFWPRNVAKALRAGLGPVLLFAPRRRNSEELARKLAAALPRTVPLQLTPEQRRLAGDTLARLLKRRVAYHHSGLSYLQRAALIEPLAKAGQLRAVVATTGLAAGINFCMRSVCVIDREYQAAGLSRMVRPDELLQMFGRAGRRGLDTTGYVLVCRGVPELHESRPLILHRSNDLDWPSFLAIMRAATRTGYSPQKAAQELAERLFSDKVPDLGFRELRSMPEESPAASTRVPESKGRPHKVKEMLNSAGEWEKLRAPRQCKLGEALRYEESQWRPALSFPDTLTNVNVGTVCRIKGKGGRWYGCQVGLAQFPKKAGEHRMALAKWLHNALVQREQERFPERPAKVPRQWTLEAIEARLLPLLPELTGGGEVFQTFEGGGQLLARLSFDNALVFAREDSAGAALLNPPTRTTKAEDFPSFAEIAGGNISLDQKKPAVIWKMLGLIDTRGKPTRRGILFSFFNRAEGLAIAAALEDRSYPVEEMLHDLANLRAGFRFENRSTGGSRLSTLCRLAYRGASYPGYLKHGLPIEYGEGAADILRKLEENPGQTDKVISEELHHGDLERARLEWHSLLKHIAHAPDFQWDRWMELKEAAIAFNEANPRPLPLDEMPPLTFEQRHRFEESELYVGEL